MKDIILELRGLANGSIVPESGICRHLKCTFNKDSDWLNSSVMRYSREWPKFTGQIRFPIPHKKLTPAQAYLEVDNKWSLWQWSSADRQYARDRRELCNFLADKLEKITV